MNKNVNTKIIALALCTTLLAGCGQTVIGEKEAFNPNITVGASDAQVEKQRVEALRIPCNYSDQAGNPWQIADENTRAASSLLFDPLVKLSPSYEPENVLAEKILSNALTYTVSIKPGVEFTDGSPLTAAEVDSSLTQAMAAGSHYQQSLANVSTHRAVDAYTLEVVLKEADWNFTALLSFPIAKASGSLYIGSGRYCLRSRDSLGIVLERNANYWGEAGSIPQIDLVELPLQQVAGYSLKMGNVDCIYSGLGSADTMNLSSSNYPVSTNHIVFLGVNCLTAPMTDLNLRRAISLAIDREFLTQGVYSSMALAAYTPFHPSFYRIKDTAKGSRNLDEAKKLVAALPSAPPPLKLLYNEENASKTQLATLVSAELLEVGIEVELIPKPYTEYMALLNSSGYDLYVGELEIPNNMDISHLMTKGENYGFGTTAYAELAQSWQNLKTAPSKESTEAFIRFYDNYLPAIPLLYRQGMFSFSRSLSFRAVTATATDLFYNIEEWQ